MNLGTCSGVYVRLEKFVFELHSSAVPVRAEDFLDVFSFASSSDRWICTLNFELLFHTAVFEADNL